MAMMFNADALRLMKVEECAGHSIEYAMGWKACIEWIKDAPTIEAIPVEWLKGLMLSTEDDVDKVEFDWIMREWESEKKEQEAR